MFETKRFLVYSLGGDCSIRVYAAVVLFDRCSSKSLFMYAECPGFSLVEESVQVRGAPWLASSLFRLTNASSKAIGQHRCQSTHWQRTQKLLIDPPVGTRKINEWCRWNRKRRSGSKAHRRVSRGSIYRTLHGGKVRILVKQ